jgi:aryl-alcohol dehydrogenase-like predicted oxidoreductase
MQTDEATARRIVDVAIEAGITFVDTANSYGAGASERILGKVLQGRRDQVVLASKAGKATEDSPLSGGLPGAAMRKAIDETLTRLRTEYLDIYYLHQPDDSTPIEETLEVMDRLVREGKVRFPATSHYPSWQVCNMVWLAESNGYKPPAIAQPRYNLLARGIEQEFLPMARCFDIATVVCNSLAGGLLTGRHREGAPVPGARFENDQVYRDCYWNPACLEAVAQCQHVAYGIGRSMVSLALNWLLHHTAADCVILGASSPGQLEQDLEAIKEGPLPAEAVAECDRIWRCLKARLLTGTPASPGDADWTIWGRNGQPA